MEVWAGDKGRVGERGKALGERGRRTRRAIGEERR